MRPLRPILLIALCLAPLTGCGGGSPAASWRDEADAICRADRVATAGMREKLEGLERTGIRTPRERAAVVALLRRGLPHLQREIAELRELDRSAEEDPSTAVELLGLMEIKHLIGERLIEGFESGDAAHTNAALEDLVANERLAERLARRIGLRVCAHL